MIVFVHGVPETAAIWDKVRGAIDRESVALALPGLRLPATGRVRRDQGRLRRLAARRARRASTGPIDLVGHDWGAGLTYRVATAHGDRLRSWAADVGNIAHPDYEWHDFAKIWQTPGEGEAFIEGQDAQSPEERAAGCTSSSACPHDDALEMAAASDADDGPLHPRPLPLRHAEPAPPLGAVGADRRARAGAAPDGGPLRRRGAGPRGRRRPRRRLRTASRAPATSGPTRPRRRRWRSSTSFWAGLASAP